MKKFYLLFTISLALAMGVRSQCVVDTTEGYLGLYPIDSTMPPIVQGQAYDTTIQVYIPYTIVYLSDTANIYWATIDTILGFPTGIRYIKNPSADTIHQNGRICLQVFGATTDTAGVYNLTFIGNLHTYSSFFGDTIITLLSIDTVLQSIGSTTQGFNFAFTVVKPAGIGNPEAETKTALHISPNPAPNGRFNLMFESNPGQEGTIDVYDAWGRKIQEQNIPLSGNSGIPLNLGNAARGLYLVQLKTAQGIYSGKVSIE